MSQPKISVIIPVYNVEKYLPKCLDSVVNQTLKDIEIICINDGSTDNSLSILEKYAQKDSRIIVINQENQGVAAARNKGLSIAKGEYIIFVDSDDYIEYNTCEILINESHKTNADILYFEYYIENTEKRTIPKHLKIFKEYFKDNSVKIDTDIFNKDFLTPTAGCICLKNSFLQRYALVFTEKYIAAEDIAFQLAILQHNPNIRILNCPLYHYVTDRENSTCNQKTLIIDELIKTFSHLIKTKNFSDYSSGVKQYALNILCQNLLIRWEELDKKLKNKYQTKIKQFLNVELKPYKTLLSQTFYYKKLSKKLILYQLFGYHNSRKNGALFVKLSPLEKIFSLKNTGRYKIITILGCRINILKPFSPKEKEQLKKLEQYKIKKNSVLLVEINDWHGEVLPGIAKYFLDLGFNIDILLSDSEYQNDPFSRMKSEKINIFPVSNMVAKKLLENPNFIDKYTRIYLNSDHTFNPIKNEFTYYWEFLDLPQRKNKYIYMTHQPNLYNLSKEKADAVMLADLPINNPNIKVVNSHYFGNVNVTPKGDMTNFIVVGNIFKDQRNYNLLFNAVNNLIEKGINNFKITSVARIGTLDFVPDSIKQYIDFKGCLNYPDMYDEIEKADFFLPLLDPLNVDHNRYITTGTSGSFQLIYGFRKPCLIAEKFAAIHGFNQQNSIVYKNNEELTDAMESAIKMDDKKYHNLQENLAQYAGELYQESLSNLKEILKCSQS